MNIRKNFGMTDQEFKAWLERFPDDPVGCLGCGLMAGCCDSYPNCQGNEDWMREQARRITEETIPPNPGGRQDCGSP
jgi:hypothetical protein